MLRINLAQRQWTLFDPKNKDHRSYFNSFLKTRSWKDCPVQWIIGDDSQDIVHYISKVLLEHYTSAEFKPKKPKTVAKKPQNLLKKVPKNG
jgi:hypothetical protein